MPPSTVRVAPVTNELSSLARNSMARATVQTAAGGPAEQPLITLLTFVAMATQWKLLAGFGGLTSFGQQAYIGRYRVHPPRG
jgi:ABC-type branched-subunit amino acid transport system permease subunit